MSEHIMISCPDDDTPVRTGYRALPGSSIEGLKQIRLKRCPNCGNEHQWDGKDAFWVEYIVEQPSLWNGFRQLLSRSRHA